VKTPRRFDPHDKLVREYYRLEPHINGMAKNGLRNLRHEVSCVCLPQPVMLVLGLGLEAHGIGVGLGTHVRLVARDTHVFEVMQCWIEQAFAYT